MAYSIPTLLYSPPNFGDGIDVPDELTTPDETGDEQLTTKQAAEILGVTVRQVRFYIENEQLVATKFGRDYVIRRADLEDMEEVRRGRPPKSENQ